MRYFAVISYDGGPFNGWQVQPGVPTVQQKVQDAFTAVLRTPVSVTGAGRTDTGVNARMMPAHMDLERALDGEHIKGLLRAVNAICRPHITVNALFPVAPEANARFDATARTYRYYVHTEASPFLGAHSLYVPKELDFDIMNREALSLLGRHDFTSFSKLHTQVKTNICTVTYARWLPVDGSATRWYFQITADRFLRNMVRAVVGTLMETGKGKAGAGHVERVMGQKDRCSAGTSVPAHPLFLWDVEYGENYPLTRLPEM